MHIFCKGFAYARAEDFDEIEFEQNNFDEINFVKINFEKINQDNSQKTVIILIYLQTQLNISELGIPQPKLV